MPVRFGYGSSVPLRMLNAIVTSDRRERQSDKEMALSALMFNIKREEAGKDRALEQLNIVQKQIIELEKEGRKKRGAVALIGGTLQALKEVGAKTGIGSDASAIVYSTMSREAENTQDITNLIKKAKTEYGVLKYDIGSYDKSIKDYHVGMGRAAADAWRKHGGDGKVDAEEFKTFMDKLKSDKNYQISDPQSFETGLNLGLRELAKEAADIKSKESLIKSRQQSRNYEEFYKRKLIYESEFIAPIKQISDEIEIESKKMVGILDENKLELLIAERKSLQKKAQKAGREIFPSVPEIKFKEKNYRLQYLKEREKMAGLGLPSAVIDKLAKVKVAVEEGLVDVDPKRKQAIDILNEQGKKITEANINYVMDQL